MPSIRSVKPLAVIAGINVAKETYSSAVTFYTARFAYSITLHPDHIHYYPFKWKLSEIGNNRAIELRHGKEFANSKIDQYLKIAGHTVKVREETPAISKDYTSPQQIEITCLNNSAKDDVRDWIIQATKEYDSLRRDASRHSLGLYQEWSSRTLIKRRRESVFLRQGMMDDIVHDIDTFMKSEDRYSYLGTPWHRGYLLYGQPGNGKSSLALAMASYFNFDIYAVSLASIKDDAQLNELFARIGPRSIVLIEDVDIFHNSTSRGKDDKGVTLQGLLNVLDGISTPHGLISILTTNNIDALDTALIRPGRTDRRFHIENPDDNQVKRMYQHYYDQPLTSYTADDRLSASTVLEVFKTHDASTAITRLKELNE